MIQGPPPSNAPRVPGTWPLEQIQGAPASPSSDLVRLPLLLGLGVLLTLLLVWLTPADGVARGLALVAVVLLGATAMGAVGPLFRLGRNEVRQAGALMQLYREISPRRTLPRTRGWAASPDFLLTLYRTVREQRPELVVEVGSGVSTLVTAYALQQNGSGRLVSLDHDPVFAERTRYTLWEHGVAGGVEVRDAPLEPIRIGDGEWRWHPQEAFQDLRAIELLVVDGPPGGAGKLARFPALPLLRSRLAPGARVLLDDGARQEERVAAERWREECGGEWSYIPLNKGLIVGKLDPGRD